jgi:hypothetical protein
MDFQRDLWDRLRSRGHCIGDIYLQTGVGPMGARMYVVIDEVAMPFGHARALDRGLLTVAQIAQLAQQSEMT